MRILLVFACMMISLSGMAQQYDFLIRHGGLVDGTGNPWIYADVAITGDKIAFIGHAPANASAKSVIDANGLVIAPGFIDMLGQSEWSLLIDKQAFSKITQGITTEITGEGESIAPQSDRTIAEMKEYLDHFHLTVDWRDLDGYFRRLEKAGSAINLGTYVGAAQLRTIVIGNANRAAAPEELGRMQKLVDEAMRQGALGISSALIYAPGSYASTDELIALAEVASKYGGIYASHIRNEGNDEMTALEEAFRIGREAHLPIEIWHLKVAGRPNWGNMPKVIAAIAQARASGVDVTADQYPYFASGTSLGAVIPAKYHEGGVDGFLGRLRDPAIRAQIRTDLQGSGGGGENMWRGTGGPDGILITSVLDPALRSYQGKTLAQVAQEQHKDPLDTLMDLVIAGRDNISAAFFSMNEDEVRLAMQQPWVAVDCDASAAKPVGLLSEGKPHPRAYGTFPRILGRYVRQEHVLRLEDAVRKMTSLPAQRVGLDRRGLVREGYFADLTIFDPQKVSDVATFEDPHRPSVGIEYVFVNGVLTLEHGQPTGRFGGRPLRGPGYTASHQ